MGGSRDQRDVDAEPWKWRRYRQNRLALKGFERALKLVFSELDRPRVYGGGNELLAHRIVERLTCCGGLDVVTLGMDVEAEEATAEKDKRKRRVHSVPPER